MEEKTTLKKIMEQKTEQMRNAIEQAIDEGAKIKHSSCVYNGYTIGGVFVQKNMHDGTLSVVLNFRSEKIAKVFRPSKDELEKMAEQKRSELEEIENQLKYD